MRYEDDETRGPVPGRAGEPGELPSPRPMVPPPDADDGTFGDDREERDHSAIRAEDTEPYVGLQYIARLFKIVAMIVVVAIVAEIVAGIALEGVSALLPLLSEVIRGGVLAAMLWGVGDLTLLFIDVGHDMRAARVLLGRLSARQDAAGYRPRSRAAGADPGDPERGPR